MLQTVFLPEGSPGTNWVVVLVSFLLAVTLWFLVTLNREYPSTFALPSKIVDIPDNVQLTDEGFTQVEVMAKGVGFDLFTEHLRLRKDTLSLDFALRKGEDFLLSRDFRASVSEHFNNRIAVTGVQPDTIYIPFEYRTQKKVPLFPRIQVRLNPSFQVDTLIVERPDSVTLVGPESVLDSIQVWETGAVALVAEEYPRRYRVPMDTLPGVKVSPKEAVIYLQPRQYAQKTLTLRLEIQNTPEDLIVKFNPPVLRLSCLVPLEDYDEISGPFTLEIDFDELDQELPFFLPRVERALPTSVKVLWRSPMEVAYVIVEKPQ